MAGINKSFRNHIFSPSSPLQFAYTLASKSKARVQACQFPTTNQPHITPVHWVSCSSFSSYRRLVSETNAQTVGQLSSLHYKTLLHNYSVKPIAGGYLQKALDQGTRSWDVTFSLYTTFVLVTALALRHAGSKPKIWNALIESAALKWRNVKMRLPSNSTNIHDLRAELTLQPRVPMRLIQDALYLNIEDSVICPVKALLVLAIRLGITYGTTIESVIDDAVQNNKGIIRWRDHAMERHVVSRIQQNADHLPYLCNDPEYTQVRLSAESMRKRIVWVLDSLKEYDKVISGKDFRVEVLEDKFIDTKSFIKCFSRINISTTPDFIVSQQTQTGESEDALPQDSHFCPNRELGCVYKSNVFRDVQYHKQVCPYTKNSSNIKWRKMFNCLEAGCSSKFSSMDKLHFHLKRTHHQIWTPRPCPHKNCHTEVFSNFEEFYQHRIAFHYTWQPTRCYVTDCRHPHLYMHEHSLYRHLRFKHGLKTREQRLVYLFPDVYLKSGRYDG